MENNNQNQWKHENSGKNTAASFVRKQLLKVCLLFCWAVALLISGRYVLFGNRSAAAPETAEPVSTAQAPEELELSEQEGPRSESIDNDVIYTKFFGVDTYLAESGSIQLKVTDAENEPITGAEFALYRDAEPNGEVSAANLINTYNSNESGIITVGLPEAAQGDRYFFIQENAPAGYEYNAGTKYYFEVLEDGSFQPQSLTVTNTRKKGSVTISVAWPGRTEPHNGEMRNVPMKNVSLTLKSDSGNNYKKMTETDSEGIASWTDLDWGDYIIGITVIGAEGGEIFYDRKLAFTIGADNIDQMFTGENQYLPAVLKTVIEVKDKITQEPLPDVHFHLYLKDQPDAEGQLIESILCRTNADGIVYFGTDYSGEDSLWLGPVLPSDGSWNYVYYLTEQAPEGYEEYSEEIQFAVSEPEPFVSEQENEKVLTAIGRIEQEPQAGSVHVQFYDAEERSGAESLSGAAVKLFLARETGIEDVTSQYSSSANYSSEIEAFISTADGITIDKLSLGNYYFSEVTAPIGYYVPGKEPENVQNNQFAFIIDGKRESNSEYDAEVEIQQTKKKGVVTLTVTDFNSHEPLADAIYTLYYSTPRSELSDTLYNLFGRSVLELGTYTTKPDGTITVPDLPWDTYYFVETEAPAGYVLESEALIPFEIGVIATEVEEKKEQFEVNVTAFGRRGTGSIKLILTDGNSNPLKNGVFELYKRGEDEDSQYLTVGEFTTDANGEITVSDLPWGSYYFREIKAPEGYYESTGDYSFTVTDDGGEIKILELNNERKTGSVRLRVISDEDIPVPLPGAKFKLYSEDGTGLDITESYSGGRETFSTNEDGYIIIQDLPFGNYYLIETEPPAGYELTYNTRTNLTISEAGYNEETGSITVFETITNSRILGYVRLQNVFVDGSPSDLSGIVYELFDVDTNVILGEYQSNEYGEVSVGPLPFGTYYFKEISLPEHLLREGYVINTERLRFEITESLSVENAILLNFLHVPTGTVSITVNLEWVLPRDRNGVAQMDYPTVTLDVYGYSEKYPEGKLLASQEVRGDIGSYTFTGLPKYDEGGMEYTLKVRERETETIEDFAVSYEQDNTDSVTIRHKVIQKNTNIRVGLNWMIPQESGFSAADATIHLLRDGVDTGVSVVTQADYVFENLERYDLSTGIEYLYTISVEAPGFLTEITGVSDYAVRLTPVQDPFEIRGSVSWSGDEDASRPSVTALLYRDGSLYKEDTVDADGSFSFTDLYVYALGEDGDAGDGHVYNYAIRQRGAERYSAVITYGEGGNSFYDSTNIVRSGSERYLPVNVQNTFRTSRISISAENGMGEPLVGARLKILDESGAIVDSWISTGTPHATEGLPDGEYRIVSLSEPAGYNRPSDYIFSISEATWEFTITIRYTAETGAVRLTVKDDNGAVIPGARYELFSRIPRNSVQSIGVLYNNNPYYSYGTYNSDENGEIIVDGLPWDDYYFVQTEAPEGYGLNVDGNGDPIVYSFAVSAATAGTVQPLESRVIAGVPIPTAEPTVVPTLEPVPSPTVTPVPTPTVIPTPTTRPTPTILPAPTPTVVPIPTPEIEPTPTPVLPPDLSGSVTLYVRRTSGGTGLSGADLKLYRVDNDILETLTRIGTYTSGVNGRVDVQNLSLGKYYFVQTKAPSGYRADNRAVSFELTNSKSEAVVEFSEK